MIGLIGPVTQVTAVGALSQHVYRSDLIPAIDTSGIQLYAAQPDLLRVLHGTVHSRAFLNAAASRYPPCAPPASPPPTPSARPEGDL
jgi:putative ABC transport system permease protein